MTKEHGAQDAEQVLLDGDPDTTGHSWDGIKEFNNPLPRWWLWTFYATCVWGLIYTIAYPAWPLVNGATAGFLGYSTRAEVAADIAEVEAATAPIRAELEAAELASVTAEGNPELYNFALRGGAAVFATWCSQCHGSGADGVAEGNGYPNLLDDDWLWGGTIDDIQQTVRHGIRSEEDLDTRWSEMTAFGDILTDEEISQVVHHVRNISGQDHDAGLAAGGAQVYLDNCASCHMEDGTGDRFLGAPNLTDAIWLYGGSEEALEHTVRFARFGVMPPWTGRLSEAEIRAVSVWVHAQGGGE